MYRYSLLIILCILSLENISFAQKTISYDFKDFKSTFLLKGEKQNTDVLLDPVWTKLHDSLLFFNNYQCNPSFSVLNLKTGKIINSFGIKGRGPGEVIAPFDFEIVEEKDWVLVNDITGHKVVKFSLNKIINKDPNPFIGEIKIKTPYTRSLWGNNELICTIQYDEDFFTHGVVDLSSGEVIRKFGHYPKLKVKYSPLNAANLFQCPLGTYLHDRKVYAVSYLDINRIEIYKNEQLDIIISGNENKNLIYNVRSDGPIMTDENHFCFGQVNSWDDKIYASYSGNPRRGSNNIKLINKILVFDLEGNLMELFNLKPPVSYVAFDFENKTIWGINKVLEPTLYKFQY